MSDRRQVVAVIAVTLLVGSVLAGALGSVALAQEDADGPPDAENVTENEALAEELSLGELQRGGERFAGDDPSLRVDGQEPYSVIHWPADRVMTNPGEDSEWRWLRPGGLVDRNAVWLRHYSLEGSESMTLHIAYYEVGENSQVTDSGEVVTEQAAQNVTVDSMELQFDRGFPATEQVDLRQSDEPREVTMWIEGKDGVRWTFTHHSVATTQSLPFSTWGGLMQWAALVWVLPLALGAIGVNWGADRLINRAGTFVRWGYGPWAVVFGLIVGGLAIFASTQSARVFVEYPYVVPAVLLFFIAILTLETLTDGVRKVRFVRDELEKTTSPSGDHAVEATQQEERTLTLIDRPDQPIRAAAPGVSAFLSRVAGGAAPVKAIKPGEAADKRGEMAMRDDPLQCAKSVTEGNVDEEVFVNPASPAVVDYRREGWEFSIPTPDSRDDIGTWLVGSVGVFAIAAIAGSLVHPAAGAGVIVLAVGVVGLSPRDGRLAVWPAPMHYRSARSSTMYLAEELDDAETIEEEREKRIRESMQTEKDITEAVDKRDSTLISAQFEPPEERDSSAHKQQPSTDDSVDTNGRHKRGDDDDDE